MKKELDYYSLKPLWSYLLTCCMGLLLLSSCGEFAFQSSSCPSQIAELDAAINQNHVDIEITQEHIDNLDSLLQVAVELENDSSIIKCANIIMCYQSRRFNTIALQEFLDKYGTKLDELVAQRKSTYLTVTMAYTLTVMGDNDAALEYYKITDEVFKETGNIGGKISYHTNFGIFLSDIGRHEEAIDHMKKSLKLSKDQSMLIAEAGSYYNLGYFNKEMGEFEEAMTYLDSAMTLDIEVKHPVLLSRILNCKAFILRERGDIEEAVDLQLAAILEAERGGDARGQIECLLELGNAYLDTDEPAMAITYLTTAHTIAEKSEDILMCLMTKHALSENYRALGSDEQAYSHLMAYTTLKDSLDTEKLDSNLAYAQAENEKLRAELDAMHEESMTSSYRVIILLAGGMLLLFLLLRYRIKTSESQEALELVPGVDVKKAA